MATKAELRRRLIDLQEFHKLIGQLLNISEIESTGWDDRPRVVPKHGRGTEWSVAKIDVDRHAARAARAFDEAGMYVQWKPPGTWNEYRINPASQWGTILDESPRFTVDVLETCINQAIGAVEARIDDPLKGERLKAGLNAHWLLQFSWWIVGTLVGGLAVGFIIYKLGWA